MSQLDDVTVLLSVSDVTVSYQAMPVSDQPCVCVCVRE